MKQLLEMNMYKVYVIMVLVIILCGWCINTYLDSLMNNYSKTTISNTLSNGAYKVVDYNVSNDSYNYDIVYEVYNNGKTYYVNDDNLSCSYDVNSSKMMIVYDSVNNDMISCDMK